MNQIIYVEKGNERKIYISVVFSFLCQRVSTRNLLKTKKLLLSCLVL